MLLQKLIVSFGFLALASAQTITSISGLDIPPACTSTCAILQQFLSANATTLVALCTTNAQQEVLACYSCIETNAPQDINTAGLATAQGGINALQTDCANVGSPLPSVTIPGFTGDAANPTPPPAGAPSSHSGAMAKTQRNLGGAVVAMAFTVVIYTI